MPGLDGTGPRGMGPMTGGGRGWCNPYSPLRSMGGPYAQPPSFGYSPMPYGAPYAMMPPYGYGAAMPPYGGYGMGAYGFGGYGMGFGRGFGRGMGRGRGFGMGMGRGRRGW